MTDHQTPPLLSFAPALVCSRWMGDHACGRPGTWHIMWTDDGENGIACDEHMAEAASRWTYWTAHPYDPVCSVYGACCVLNPDGTSVCQVDDDGLLVAEVAAAGRLS